MRTAAEVLARADAPGAARLELRGREIYAVPLVDAYAVAPANAYVLALYEPMRANPTVAGRSAAGDLLVDYQELALVGWALHLPWAKNPAPMNRSGSRGGWRDAARQSRTVRDVAFTLARAHIPRQHRIRVMLHWHVVTKRTRDEDNLVRCMKHLVDGLRLAGVVDDDDRTYVLRDMPEIVHRPAADGGYAHMRLYVLRAS